MNEERAGREGSSRGSGDSRDAFGAAGGPTGEPVGLPRQGEQPRGAGLGRRRAAAAQFGPAELAAALNHSVATVGAGGPPRAGLARIRRRAKARQRRRTVMASSAGVMLLAMAVAAVTGSSFDIVPVLTGVVGLGGRSGANPGPSQSPQSGGPGQVRTVLPSAESVGKKGPAIGPVPPAAAVAALAASGVVPCTAADLKTTASVDSVIGGASYGHVEAVANTTCAVLGPPALQVQNAAGTAVGSVVILRHEASDGSQLPGVSTWGTVLKLQAGQGYDFQFAWAPDACTGGGSGPVGQPSGGQSTAASPGGASGASGGSGVSGASGATNAAASGAPGGTANVPAATSSAESVYALSYLVGGATSTAPVSLNASCGATVYVTDIYNEGAYPLPQPPATPSPQPSTTSAPPAAPSQSPTTQPPPASTAPSTAASTPAPPSPSPTTSTPTPSASTPATSDDPANETPDAPTSS
jgi:hypothetical protein